jgi:hypothetical protein
MTISCFVPVSYVVRGVLAGRSGTRDYTFAELVPVEIEEVSREEAPLSVSWNSSGMPQDCRIDYFNHDELRSFHWEGGNHAVFHDGRHWVRKLRFHSRTDIGPSDELTIEELLGGIESGEYNRMFRFAPLPLGGKDFQMVTADPTDQFKTVASNGRQQAFRTLERLRILSVDGIVHIACDQPCYALAVCDRYARGDNPNVRFYWPYVSVREGSVHDSPHISDTLMLPFSAQDELQAILSAMPEGVTALNGGPTIHLPASMSPDEDLRVAADYHVRRFASTGLKSLRVRFPALLPYFEKTSVEEKIDFLIAAKSELAPAITRLGLSGEPLDHAIELLDAVSISAPVLADRRSAVLG